jgi:hypothetical protein
MKEPSGESVAPATPSPGADGRDSPGGAGLPAISLTHGRLCIVLAALLWSTSGAFTKLLTKDTGFGLDQPTLEPLQIAFGRAFFAALSLLPLLRRSDLAFRPAMISTPA